jgi:type VI secretion system protein ImpH
MEAMASYGWRQGRSVTEALFEEGHLFGFEQALHLLELIYKDRTPVAEGVDPDREVVRMRSNVRFDFPASEVETITEADGDEPASMTVNIMGLAGALGPLPPWVTELAMDRSARGDRGLADFLDLFNHRLLSLLYRARKKHRPALDGRTGDKGRMASALFALIGLGTPHTRGALGISDRALLAFSGILAMRQRSMTGLERILACHFDVGAEIVPFQGRWSWFDESETTRIGATGRHQLLGQGAVLGVRTWDPESSFEVRLGPLTAKQFNDLLPRKTWFRAAVSLVRFYVGEDLGFTFRLLLQAPDVPELRLGRKGGSALGWKSWLKSRPFTHDDAQVCLVGRA